MDGEKKKHGEGLGQKMMENNYLGTNLNFLKAKMIYKGFE